MISSLEAKATVAEEVISEIAAALCSSENVGGLAQAALRSSTFFHAIGLSLFAAATNCACDPYSFAVASHMFISGSPRKHPTVKEAATDLRESRQRRQQTGAHRSHDEDDNYCQQTPQNPRSNEATFLCVVSQHQACRMRIDKHASSTTSQGAVAHFPPTARYIDAQQAQASVR